MYSPHGPQMGGQLTRGAYRQGPGPHSSEASYEGFLRLTGEMLDLSQLHGKPLARAEAG